VTKFALYTDVFMFSSWIREHSGKIVSQRSTPASTSVCGRMSGSSPLIQGGFHASKEIFPWTVLIRDVQDNDRSSMHYSITGTLVSNRHVVSSARFVSYYDDSGKLQTVDTNSLQLYFGVGNLNSLTDAGVSSSGVSRIILYPKYIGDHDDIDEGSLAVLVASKRLEFTRFVQPICLWPQTQSQADVEGKFGFAVGWGFDENLEVTEDKKYIRVIVENENFCKSYYGQNLESVTFSKYFCINAVTKGVPCHGDSPLYIKAGDKWYLRGLFGLSIFQEDSSCNPESPTLYEDVAPMTNWILSTMRTV
jgi:Trypsin